MPIFTIKLTYRDESDQKAHLEQVVHQLRSRGAYITNIQSSPGKVGESLNPINVVTITYEAVREIKLS